MSTLGEMKARIADELDRSDADFFIAVDREIRSAIKHFETARFTWNEKVIDLNVTAGTEWYASTTITDLIKVDSWSLIDGGWSLPMARRKFEWIEERQMSPGVRGMPTDWAHYDRRLRVYPIPDRNYAGRAAVVYRLESLGTADGDSNDWLSEGEALIRLHASMNVAGNWLRDFEKAAALRVLRDDAFAQLTSELDTLIETGTTDVQYF
jgi:hypothetical protein